ncbi:hypothetical protein TSUD_161710 [Trifolium subterraneum]|uniref:Uncharacterized protein n=1 Tax=Trifolium subterraneum TaxID=3900 RepID=A0A2Z6MB12_TRISU|nr:hypothetical protein TSUD_161710 [Trifolium subterraneum]
MILSQYVLCLRVYSVDPPLHILLEATSVMVEIRCDSTGSFCSAMLRLQNNMQELKDSLPRYTTIARY